MKRESLVTRVLLPIIVVLLLFATACDIATPTESSTSTPATIEPSFTPVPLSVAGSSIPSMADMIATVYPSVVTINTQTTTYSFFYGQQVQEGAGSGWIYRQDGIIVTNNHVVEGAQTITVGLADGRAFEAQKVYTDAVADLAIVKIDANNLPTLPVGDSAAMRVGDWVVAIGNSLGQGLRASEGIISGMDVSLSANQGESLSGLVETSAAINPGNSGGPLVNLAGEIIGINSAKISAVGVEGMGYAISTRIALPILSELLDKGYVTRPSLGADLVTVTPYIAMLNRLSVDEGAVISQVVSGGPADQAGLNIGDVIISFSGQTVTTADELNRFIHAAEIGQSVEIRYVRDRNTRTTTVKLGESPKP